MAASAVPLAGDMDRSLDALFRPRTVAVIGASRDPRSIGGEAFHNLISTGFSGAVYPVNPAARVVQSVRAYPSIEDVPDEVDLAVIAAPQPAVLEIVDACARRKVRALIVMTAGFAEVGIEGQRLQRWLADRLRAHGIRMLGPNCLGLINTHPALMLNATFAPTWPPRGPVAMVSQSGAVALALLDHAAELGTGLTQLASIDNAADVAIHDLLEYREADEATRVIVLYVEDFGNPARFLEVARRVARHKPIVVVKSGRTAAGARAATSHSGALAGTEIAVDALLGQAGVIRTETLEELFDVYSPGGDAAVASRCARRRADQWRQSGHPRFGCLREPRAHAAGAGAEDDGRLSRIPAGGSDGGQSGRHARQRVGRPLRAGAQAAARRRAARCGARVIRSTTAGRREGCCRCHSAGSG